VDILSGKEFKKQFLNLVGKHPYSWADKNGIDKGIVSRVIQRKNPEAKNLLKLANALNISVERLLTGSVMNTHGDIKIHTAEKAAHTDGSPCVEKAKETEYQKRLRDILECNHEDLKEGIKLFIDATHNILKMYNKHKEIVQNKKYTEDRVLKEIIDMLKDNPEYKENVWEHVQNLVNQKHVLERIEKYKTDIGLKYKTNVFSHNQIDGLLNKIASKENAQVLLDIFEEIIKSGGINDSPP